MDKSIGEQIREARLANGMTQQSLADAVGVTKGAVSQWEKGNTAQIKHTNLIALSRALGVALMESDQDVLRRLGRKQVEALYRKEFGGFPLREFDDMVEVLALKGAVDSNRLPRNHVDATENFKEVREDHLSSYSAVEVRPAEPLDGDTQYVSKVCGVNVSAGPGAIAFAHEEVDGSHAFKRSWLRQKGITSVDRCRMVEVRGESMWPYLMDGDIVLVNLDETAIRSGEVYVLAVDDELRVKRLNKRMDGAVEIISDNPAPQFPTEVLEGEKLAHLRIVGRVVWRGG